MKFFIFDNNIFWILDNKEDAGYHYGDLENFFNKKKLYFYPSSYNRENNFKNTNSQNIFRRTEFIRNYQKNKNLTVTYPDALFEKIIINKELKKEKINLRVGDVLNLETFNEKLFDLSFERVDFVVEPGNFFCRGGIVDVFHFLMICLIE